MKQSVNLKDNDQKVTKAPEKVTPSQNGPNTPGTAVEPPVVKNGNRKSQDGDRKSDAPPTGSADPPPPSVPHAPRRQSGIQSAVTGGGRAESGHSFRGTS